MSNELNLSNSEAAHFQCFSNAAEIPLIVFWIASLAFVWVIARQNNFGIIDAVLAACGYKKFPRTPLINTLNVLVLAVPGAMAVYFIRMNCP